MSEMIEAAEFVAVMQDSFLSGQQVTFIPSGTSMLPMLNGKDDKVTLAPKPEKLCQYDVALYRRPDTKQLVLHRVVRVGKDGTYVFSGDNQYYTEKGISDGDILAVTTAFTHKGKEILPNQLSYRVYVRIMMCKKTIRMLLHKIYRKIFRK